jgi:D-proline reductase (dithiol) PrdB
MNASQRGVDPALVVGDLAAEMANTTNTTSDVVGYDIDRLMTDVLGLPKMDIPVFEPPELMPLTAVLEELTVGLLVTCGAYYPDQPRMRETNDLSYRLLPRDRGLEDILLAHKTPIRAFAEADANVAYPLERMLDLEREGSIGRYADVAVSMVGSIRLYEELATETAPKIVEEMRAVGTELLLVLPFCPQCHVAAGILARAIEQRGLPTTSVTTAIRPAMALKPPRATFLDFPLGCPTGPPGRADVQLEVLHAALLAGVNAPAEWELSRLPFLWPSTEGREWEQLVDDLYRVDNAIRGTVAERMRATQSITGQEREFAIRCVC